MKSSDHLRRILFDPNQSRKELIELSSLNILKHLGGNENSFGSPLIDSLPDGIMEMPSDIRLLAFLILGNVFASE